MKFNLLSVTNEGNKFIDVNETNNLISLNSYSEKYGLALSELQVKALIQTKSKALVHNKRIEFSGTIISALVKEFCSSPYLCTENYEDTLHELIQLFYYFKNETKDRIADDDLVAVMKTTFDNSSMGVIELFTARDMPLIIKKINNGEDF